MDIVGLDKIFNAIELLNEVKTSNINSCLGEILSSDIVATKNLPCFDNAALDGYAFNYNDVDKKLIVKGTIFAGDKNSYEIKNGECYKIMTGAKIPKNADTILMLENAKFEEDLLIIDKKTTAKNSAYRYIGEEIKKGEILLKKGTLITPSTVMYLASQGITEVLVNTKPKIAIFSTGNEIKEPWENADENEIYNSNASGIGALLNKYSFESEYLGIIKDSKDETFAKLNQASQTYDVIITSGGASKGEADFMHEILSLLKFEQILDGILLKPAGKPTKCYKKGKKLVFVLPGNPMGAFLITFLILIPTLKKLIGSNLVYHKKIKTTMKGKLKLKANRSNVVYGIYENGLFKVLKDNKYGSGMIRPLVESNAIYISKFSESLLQDGQILEILLTKV